jgi:hypothetical protein
LFTKSSKGETVNPPRAVTIPLEILLTPKKVESCDSWCLKDVLNHEVLHLREIPSRKPIGFVFCPI